MKGLVYFAAFVMFVLAIAQLGNALMIILLAMFSVAVMSLLVVSIQEINRPPQNKKQRS
tara:strand:- start:119 stop:295 length:177 start_codon:yes stop_codon:yes gene_type:complete